MAAREDNSVTDISLLLFRTKVHVQLDKRGCTGDCLQDASVVGILCCWDIWSCCGWVSVRCKHICEYYNYYSLNEMFHCPYSRLQNSWVPRRQVISWTCLTMFTLWKVSSQRITCTCTVYECVNNFICVSNLHRWGSLMSCFGLFCLFACLETLKTPFYFRWAWPDSSN